MATPAPAPQNVALLMPFAGIDQAEITADYSAEPKTSTVVGGPILTQAQRRGRYDVSGEFSTGGHIVTESHPSFDFGGQWVVEFWVFLPHAAIAGTVTQRPFLAAMDKDSNLNRLQFFLSEALPYPSLLCWSDATGHLYDGPVITWGADYLDRWVHVVYQRGSDGRVSVFRDGILEGTGTNTSVPAYRDFITFNVSRAGGVPNSTSIMYLSDVRITCGEAFYPLAGFVPPEHGLLYVPPTRQSVVSGVVQIDKAPAKRTVRAFGYNPTTHDLDGDAVSLSKSLGHATSDPDTGEYTIDLLAGYDQQIFVVAFDDYGAEFTPDLAVAVGDRVHPATPNGYVWECAGAGNLPSEEPAWVIDTETAQLYGTASMIARPFYRPMVHGPVTPEVVEPDPEP